MNPKDTLLSISVGIQVRIVASIGSSAGLGSWVLLLCRRFSVLYLLLRPFARCGYALAKRNLIVLFCVRDCGGFLISTISSLSCLWCHGRGKLGQTEIWVTGSPTELVPKLVQPYLRNAYRTCLEIPDSASRHNSLYAEQINRDTSDHT